VRRWGGRAGVGVGGRSLFRAGGRGGPGRFAAGARARLLAPRPAPRTPWTEPSPRPPRPLAAARVRLDHVTFGLVLGDDNKKFRSRSGDVVRLVDLLDKARDDCAATIRERSPEISAGELAAAAAAMGYGAVKYADLRSHRASNYRFSFDEMLALKVRVVRGGGWG
jgi:hypothetical protein